jgi:hypothetical protein
VAQGGGWGGGAPGGNYFGSDSYQANPTQCALAMFGGGNPYTGGR